MPKYYVYFARCEQARIEVEASGSEEACEKAEKKITSEDWESATGPTEIIDWEVID